MSSSEARADWVRSVGWAASMAAGQAAQVPVSTTAAEAARPTSDAAVLHCQIASSSQGAVVAAPSVASAAQEGAQRVALAAPPPNVTAAGGGTQSAGGSGGVNSVSPANNGQPGASGTGGAGGPGVLNGSAGGGGGGGYFGGGGGAGGTLLSSGTGGGGSSFPVRLRRTRKASALATARSPSPGRFWHDAARRHASVAVALYTTAGVRCCRPTSAAALTRRVPRRVSCISKGSTTPPVR